MDAPPAAPVPGPAGRPEAIRAVPVRHPGRWVAAVVVVGVTAGIGYSLASAPGITWTIVGNFFFDPRIMAGLQRTIWLTGAAMGIGILLGMALAVMRLSPNPIVSSGSWFYIWFFRGTPVLVQIIFWYNIKLLFPNVVLGIPFGPVLTNIDLNDVVTPLLAALLGLGLNEGAYMAEIIRAGFISVDIGQTEASQALGMTRLQTMRRIVLPQAMRVVVPPTGNETISMLKTTSLVSVISYPELLTSAENISGNNYRIMELLVVASIWYLVCTSVLTVGQYYLERHFGRGTAREQPPTPLQRLRRLVMPGRGVPPPPSGAAPATVPGASGEGR